MLKNTHSTAISSLVFFLVGSIIAYPAHAWSGSGSSDDHIQSYSTESFGPIGRIMTGGLASDETVRINGLPSQREQLIWDADLIETTSATTTRLSINLIGQISLGSHVKVRLATRFAEVDAGGIPRVLVASLVKGQMVITLKKEAAAYVESGQSTFSASGETIFRIRAGEGVATIETIKGTVKEELFQRPNLYARAVSQPLGPTQRQVVLGSIKVREKERKKILAQVTRDVLFRRTSLRGVLYSETDAPNNLQVPQSEEVAPNRILRFKVIPPIGTIDPPVVTTTPLGMAEITFTGVTKGSAIIYGEIERFNDDGELRDLELAVEVTKLPIYQRKPVLIGAAVAGVLVVVLARPRKEKGPLIQQPPPEVR
jgi:hypothetical protein